MEEKSWQGRGSSVSAGEKECKRLLVFLSMVFPKAKCKGSPLRRCYGDCQELDLETLTFRNGPGPTGLGGCPATLTKVTATLFPITRERCVCYSREHYKNLRLLFASPRTESG